MRHLAVLSLVFLFIAGCAPGLGSRLVLPNLPDADISAIDSLSGGELKVRVGRFVDSRPSEVLAEVNGRGVMTDGKVGPVMEDAFSRYYTAAGAKVVAFGAPTVVGEVVEWRTIVVPKFPSSEVTALAKFNLELRGPDENVLYRANYSGEAAASHPIMTEASIQDILAEAMASAVREAVNDSALLTRIGRAGAPL